MYDISESILNSVFHVYLCIYVMHVLGLMFVSISRDQHQDKLNVEMDTCGMQFPDPEGQPTFDDSFVHVEIVRTIIATAGRSRASPILKSPHLEKSLVIAGRVMGFDGISKYVEALDAKGQWDLLRRVYATINQRSLSDPSMLSFFKVVGWDN